MHRKIWDFWFGKKVTWERTNFIQKVFAVFSTILLIGSASMIIVRLCTGDNFPYSPIGIGLLVGSIIIYWDLHRQVDVGK